MVVTAATGVWKVVGVQTGWRSAVAGGQKQSVGPTHKGGVPPPPSFKRDTGGGGSPVEWRWQGRRRVQRRFKVTAGLTGPRCSFSKGFLSRFRPLRTGTTLRGMGQRTAKEQGSQAGPIIASFRLDWPSTLTETRTRVAILCQTTDDHDPALTNH